MVAEQGSFAEQGEGQYERRMINLASMGNSRLQRIGLVCWIVF